MHGSIHGYIIRLDNGQPVAGAQVSIVPLMAHPNGRTAQQTRVTNGAGWFTVEGLPPGSWYVVALGPNGGTGEARVSVFDNATTEVTINLNGLQRWLASTLATAAQADDMADVQSRYGVPDTGPSDGVVEVEEQQSSRPAPEPTRTGSVRGQVVCDSGQPISDATITIVRGAGPAPDIAPVTDSEGHFAMDGLPWGDWELSATDPTGGHGWTELRIWGDEAVTVVIRIGSERASRTSHRHSPKA